MSERIRDGVFFQLPAVLPRGRHELTREQVLAAQRERLMIAMTELVAERGYQRVGIRDVAARAGVSSGAFYECFTDKEACVFAAYDRFIAVLLERLAVAPEPGLSWEEWVQAIVAAYLGTLQRDPVVGRAFQVEMDAVGADARERRRQALTGLAGFIRAERERLWPAEEAPIDASAYIGVVYAVRQIACDELDRAEHPDLLALAPDLASWISWTLRGHARDVTSAPAPARPRRAAG